MPTPKRTKQAASSPASWVLHIFSFGMGVLPLIGVGDEKGVLRAGREAKSLADARRSTP
jgi:hypothetical protein